MANSSATKARPTIQGNYSDEELGYVQATLDRPVREAAEHLGRSIGSIDSMRRRVRSGWVRKHDLWTLAEDEILISNAGVLGGEDLAKLLPGRSTKNVYDRLNRLGVRLGHRNNRNPFFIADRQLLARTCTHCGLLLPAKWFVRSKKRAQWGSWCRSCKNGQMPEYRRQPHAKERKKSLSKYEERAQAISLKLSVNKGVSYTEADHRVMADPSLTALTKALILGRTYYAVAAQMKINGYHSHTRPITDPSSDQWLINNPNSDRVEEITANLRRDILEAGKTLPEWDWDD